MFLHKKIPIKNLAHALLVGMIASSGMACLSTSGRSTKTNAIVNYTSCIIRSDQGAGSFQGRWSALPVRLVFDKEFYVADGGAAVNSLRNAVNTWNGWAAIKGLPGFSINNDGSGQSAGMDIPNLTDCSQASYSAAVTDLVGVWKITSYGPGKNQRDSCGTNAKILPDGVQGQTDWIVQNGVIVGSSILLNFEGFNAPGMRKIDVESLMLHELGHVFGLLHSCNGSSDGSDATSSPNCDLAPSDYINAVMYPYLQVGQMRRSLLQNDYNRINCLY